MDKKGLDVISDTLQEFTIEQERFFQQYYTLRAKLEEFPGEPAANAAIEIMNSMMWDPMNDYNDTVVETFQRVLETHPELAYLYTKPYRDNSWIRGSFEDGTFVYTYITYDVMTTIIMDESNDNRDIEFGFDNETSLMSMIIIELKDFNEFAEWIEKYIR